MHVFDLLEVDVAGVMAGVDIGRPEEVESALPTVVMPSRCWMLRPNSCLAKGDIIPAVVGLVSSDALPLPVDQ